MLENPAVRAALAPSAWPGIRPILASLA